MMEPHRVLDIRSNELFVHFEIGSDKRYDNVITDEDQNHFPFSGVSY